MGDYRDLFDVTRQVAGCSTDLFNMPASLRAPIASAIVSFENARLT